MPILAATWILRLAAVYLAAGLLFALPFVWRGIEGLDPAARGSSWGFRLLVLPGSIALWPVLLRRLRRRRAAAPAAAPTVTSVTLRRRQRRLLQAVALLLAIGLVMALAGRPEPASNAQLPSIDGGASGGEAQP